MKEEKDTKTDIKEKTNKKKKKRKQKEKKIKNMHPKHNQKN